MSQLFGILKRIKSHSNYLTFTDKTTQTNIVNSPLHGILKFPCNSQLTTTMKTNQNFIFGIFVKHEAPFLSWIKCIHAESNYSLGVQLITLTFSLQALIKKSFLGISRQSKLNLNSCSTNKLSQFNAQRFLHYSASCSLTALFKFTLFQFKHLLHIHLNGMPL